MIYNQKTKGHTPTLEKWPCKGTLEKNEPYVIKIPYTQDGIGTTGHCFLWIDEAKEILKHSTLIKQFINMVEQEKFLGNFN